MIFRLFQTLFSTQISCFSRNKFLMMLNTAISYLSRDAEEHLSAGRVVLVFNLKTYLYDFAPMNSKRLAFRQ